MATYDGMFRRAPVVATDDEAELERIAELAERRRLRANLLEDAMARQDLAEEPGTGGAATIESRRGQDGVSRLYAVDGGGAITAPTDLDRPLGEDEWAELDRALESGDRDALGRIYSPGRRRRGIGYAEDGFISEAEMARRRQEAYGDPGTASPSRFARAARIRNAFAEERAYGNGPSARQEAARQRWDAARAARSAYPSERNARRVEAAASRAAEAERALATREHQMKLAELEAGTARYGADAQVKAAEAKGLSDQRVAEIQQKGALSVEELRGMNAQQLQALLNGGNLAVARAEGESRVKAAEAAAAGVRDAGLAKAHADALVAGREAQTAAQKRGMELLGLAVRIQNGGKDENTLKAMEMMVDSNNSLTDDEKARKKAELRNVGDMKAFLPMIYQQMGDAFGAAGYPAEGAGAPRAEGGAQAQPKPGVGGEGQSKDGRNRWGTR